MWRATEARPSLLSTRENVEGLLLVIHSFSRRGSCELPPSEEEKHQFKLLIKRTIANFDSPILGKASSSAAVQEPFVCWCWLLRLGRGGGDSQPLKVYDSKYRFILESSEPLFFFFFFLSCLLHLLPSCHLFAVAAAPVLGA